MSVLLVFTDRIVVSCNKSSTKQQDQKAFKSSGRVRKRAEFRSVGARIKKMSFFTACRLAKRSNQSYKRTPSRETPTIQRASPRFSLIKARNTLKTDSQRTIVRSSWLEWTTKVRWVRLKSSSGHFPRTKYVFAQLWGERGRKSVTKSRKPATHDRPNVTPSLWIWTIYI